MKIHLWCAIAAMVLLTGCGKQENMSETGTEAETEIQIETEQEQSAEVGKSEDFSAVANLLGMQDKETETLLGGGTENWTTDHSFYIGRIFQTELYGESCSVYTTCNEQEEVESVSVQIVSGERMVTEDEVNQWAERISDYTEVEPSEKSEISEGGSQQIEWVEDKKIVTLRYMKDNLSISFQNQKGELEEGKQTDNFTVDKSEAEEFAVKIKHAVSEKNLETLADLTAFPVYIGFPEGGQFIENREEFLALGAEKIFTDELVASIEAADETGIKASEAGFTLTKENGAANIVFGLRDGELSVSGVNY